ncbi:polysaccharide deacetylase [Candidatus Scalindua japonica]|uniref:Polysaccharide deacetylase n=1 Tax=Candidatus Scalindua japonica TaxID=1284222 RepID=A0A286U470_9BACT|nr:XrtA system polysaccharide deacetylase [Candidatus Scalindua japonica]GAX62948.1 polysaccharide deacetylase [Candidatus Scalindua japonica]
MLNAITIDVEEYFQVSAFEKYVKCEEWGTFPPRVELNTLKILDMLDEFSVKATFFILGWIAEHHPSLIREVQKRGHEIACHGYNHELIYNIGHDRFRQDIKKAKMLLEDLCGREVSYYRAPSYSITEKSLWALDILIEEGFTCDSSIFPIHHDLYGIPDAIRFPHTIDRQHGVIREFPVSTFEVGFSGHKFRIPVSGGGYLRLLPVRFIKRALRHINECEREPVILYFHPWEIDPEQPRIRAGIKSRFRHYINLDRTMGKIKYLLSSFRFAPVSQVLDANEN